MGKLYEFFIIRIVLNIFGSEKRSFLWYVRLLFKNYPNIGFLLIQIDCTKNVRVAIQCWHERGKKIGHILRTRHTTTYTFTRIENKRNPNTKPLHTVLSQQNEGKNCMNLYGAHVVQVDNLQRNISKTWINYEPTYTHNRVTLASYSYSYRIQYKTGTRIRYLHGASQKSHDSQSLLLSYSGWFWLYVETVFRFHSISFVCICSRFSLYSNICTISILDNTPTMSVYHTSDCRMKRWKGWGKLYMYKHISLWLTFTYSSTFCWLLTKFQWLVCSNLFHFDASLL